MNTRTLALAFLTAALVLALLSAPSAVQAGQVVDKCYVDAGAPPGGDGTIWATAYNDLQAALTRTACNPIWVANGIYKPDGASLGDRGLSFRISPEVAVYGGFHGDPSGETDISQRDWETNLTILSGDIDSSLNTCGAGGDESCADLVDANGITASHEDIVGANSYHVVFIYGETVDATSATVLDGFIVTAGDAAGSLMNMNGGGLYCSGRWQGMCSASLQNLAFNGNRAASCGGAMYNDTYPGGIASPSIRDSSFSGNHAEGDGGAMFNLAAYNGISSPILTDVEFINNSSHGHGGGMYNFAEGNPDYPSTNSSPSLTRVSFTSNSAGSGGGVYNNARGAISSPILTDVTFTTNSGSGGGMSSAASLGGTSSPQLTDVHFVNNGPAAGGYGGAMWSQATDGGESSPVLSQVTFEQNHAMYGGAWYGEDSGGSSQANLDRVLFIHNVAAQDGGAIYHFANGANSSLSVTNAAFSRNEAGSNGGAIYNSGAGAASSLTAINVSFANNTAEEYGGALFDVATGGGAASATLRNAVLTGYGSGYNDIYNSGAAATVNIAYSDLSGNCGDIGGATCGSGNVNVEPGYVDAASDNLRLQDDSPVIDAGDNEAVPAGITTDLDNRPRFRSNPLVEDTGNGTPPIVDMGAYENTLFCPSDTEALYVDRDATGADDGASWVDAFTHLEDALDRSDTCGGTNIWVAEGVYKPTDDPADTYATFDVPPQSKVYGGFAGGEDELTDRDWTTNVTVLSGDIDASLSTCGTGGDESCADVLDADGVTVSYADIRGANSAHVVTMYGVDPTPISGDAVLDGFTVTAGQASDSGGGMYCMGAGFGGECSPSLSNLRFMGNYAQSYGGGLFLNGAGSGTSNPSLLNVLFSGNSAASGGGMGAWAYDSGTGNPTLVNVIFRENHVTSEGGGLYLFAIGGTTNPALYNTIFANNVAGGEGGAMMLQAENGTSNPFVVNSAFSGNQSPGFSPALYVASTGASGTASFYNTIFWGNTGAAPVDVIMAGDLGMSLHYSILENGSAGIVGLATDPYTAGFGNRDQDPNFVDAANGDLHLQSNSPAIDAGANDQIQSPIEILTDLDGNPRIVDDPAIPDTGLDSDPGTPPYVDIGPYEYQFACPAAGPLFVDADAAGTNDGSSWTNAFPKLQSGLGVAAACPGMDVYVAKGIYRPSDDGDQQESFVIPPGVAVYGGYAGAEVDPDPSLRDLAANPTVLSGDIDYLEEYGQDDVDPNGVADSYEHLNGNNSQHVVMMDGTGTNPVTSSTVLDGFIITGGRNLSVEDEWYSYGGGLLCDGHAAGHECSPTLANLVFSGNYAYAGGALFNYAASGGTSSPQITDVQFIGNGALMGGGAIFAWNGAGGTMMPVFANVSFIGNRTTSSSWGDGGAVWHGGNGGLGAPQFRNVLFLGNYAEGLGGALFLMEQNSPGSPQLTNVTFAGNEAADGGGAIATDAYSEADPPGWPVLTNVILWANLGDGVPNQIYNYYQQVEINYSLVEGGDDGIVTDGLAFPPTAFASGTGNLDVDPLYRDFDGGDMRLQPLSPASDAGDNTAVTVTTDLDHNPRLSDNPFAADTGNGTAPFVDMGAYEFQIVCPQWGQPIYVDDDAAGLDDGSSWEDAYTDLNEGLTMVGACLDSELRVAQGIYTPTSDDDQTVSFIIPPGAAVYGGYPGLESEGGSRDPTAYPTILSGDIDNDNSSVDGVAEFYEWADEDNSEIVVRIDGTLTDVTATTVLDGFIITAGKHEVELGGEPEDGAGLYCDGHGAGGECSPTLSNLVFSGNYAERGGAFFLNATEGGTGSPTLTNVYFHGNGAEGQGGAVLNEGFHGTLDASFTNVTFESNEAQTGGGLYDSADGIGSISTTSLTNVTFVDNWAYGSGGGAVFSGTSGDASPSLTNVTFLDNEADNGGAIALEGFLGSGTPVLTNVILWGDWAEDSGDEIYSHEELPSINYSIVMGGESNIVISSGVPLGTPFASGTGNLDDNPMVGGYGEYGGFAPTLRLEFGSPAIDAGTNTGCPAADQRGVSRPQNGDLMGSAVCDIGAYELAAYSISGNAGTASAALGYNVDGPLSVIADGSGAYSLLVPEHWVGSVTPSKTSYAFTPDHRFYDDVTADQTLQNYTAKLTLIAPTILRHTPEHLGTTCTRATVSVTLLLTDMVRTPSGAFDPSQISLWASGQDVTSLARITVSQTYPASHATLTVTARSDLRLGMHRAWVTYPAPGGPQTHSWDFNVTGVPCSPTSAPLTEAQKGAVDAPLISEDISVWGMGPAAANVSAGTAMQSPYRRASLRR